MAITMTYPVGDPAPVTLTLPGSLWDEPSGYLSTEEINRTLDGSLESCNPFTKRFKNLKWEHLTAVQKAGLEALWAYGGPFTFADAVDTDNQFIAKMMSAPQLHQVYSGAWAGEVEVQEI